MALINISIINASTILQDSDIQPVVDALQKQRERRCCSRHLAF